jgi:hypothetical protein
MTILVSNKPPPLANDFPKQKDLNDTQGNPMARSDGLRVCLSHWFWDLFDGLDWAGGKPDLLDLPSFSR